jgi:uncharacterized phage protein (TIGR01671 family)
MREIEFRGKRKDTGGWVYGNYIYYKENCSEKRHMIAEYVLRDKDYFDYHVNRYVHPETVGQYTGLRDKAGQKIFEGDLVRNFSSVGDPVISPVVWADGAFWLRLNNSKKEDWLSLVGVTFRDYELEVIGNIHDNGELLEAGK